MTGGGWRSWFAAVIVTGCLAALYAWKGGAASLFLLLLALFIIAIGGFIQLSGPRQAVVRRTWHPISPYDGEEIEVTIAVSLAGGMPPLWLRVQDHIAGEEEEGGRLLFTGFKREHTGKYRLNGMSRGLYAEGATKIVWGDFFGWFTGGLQVRGTDKLLVQPLPLQGLSSSALKGCEENDRLGKPIYSNEVLAGDSRLRKYELGDPLGRIHWKSSARSGSLITRLPDERQENPPSLLLDTNEKSYCPDTFEIAISAAAAWLHQESAGTGELYFYLGMEHYGLQIAGKEGLFSGLEMLAKARIVKNTSDRIPALIRRGINLVPGQRITVITGYLTSPLVAKVLQMADAGASLNLWHAGPKVSNAADEMLAQLGSRGIQITYLLPYASSKSKMATGGNEHVIA
ncbi:DUF58 domain-containing protein [Paenibacillus fonticola]|uniref:DUF58 domain-containing protein n=1 Tax=Paenibacillus fonticola TaxID=379896 RepID=UPI00036EA443|nr:DUF58 domain-containing protein [Paenibacillus fonticola]